MGMKRKNSASGLVYSTDHGRMCPGCGSPQQSCSCSKKGSQKQGDGIVRVSRQTKGRKGKGVTLVTGIPLEDAELRSFLKELKKKLGLGGAVKEGTIELQGDVRDQLVSLLEARGWKVKRAGG